VAGGGWASSGADEEGRGATMELKSAIMPPLGPTAEAVAMALWPRHQCVGCASSGVSGGGWTCPGVDASGCPSSSPGGGGWPMPRADEEGRETVRHCGGGSEASIGRRVRAGLTVQGCARVLFCISIKALLGS
jgi:hypothetical protein